MTAFPNVAERISEAHHGISGRRLTFLVLLLALSCGVLTAGGLVQAMPKDGKVIAGGADIVQSTPNRLDINQRSANAVIDWRSFSIDVDEHTHFRQPSASSMTLNRVRGDSYSNLLGKLTANGRVMLLNPNGILFGKTAVVDVAGLVATTIDIRNEDFMAGRFNFAINHNPGGTVVNRGRITAAEGGLVALVAPGVENSGVIRARLGRVALASGNAFTFDLHGDSLIRLRVDDRVAERLTAPDGAPLAALVDNSGTINADGGAVWLAASAAKDVVDRVINMDGIVEARSVGMRNGHIQLLGNGEGIVRVAGKLDASGKGRGETGGSVKVLGEKVGVVEQAKIDASGHSGGGTTLIGGNFQGKGPERNAEYATVGGDVTIRADATGTGNGGKVIVWSERVTRFLGSISARGGTHSGDGGFAEVSGKRHLQFAAAAVDLRAPGGSAGELLLDPRDITISDGDGTNNNEVSADGEISFGSDSNDYNIQPVAFEAIDGDVTLQAQRDMTVSSPIDRSGSSSSTLSLQAGRHLTINAAITGTNGAHNFIFEADSPRSGNNDGIGTLTIGSSGSITSNNGDVTLIGAGFAIDLASSIDAGTGDIHVAPSQSVLMTISAGAGNLSNAEIGRFVTSGSIIIGTATTGPTGTGQAGSSIVASAITVGESLSIGGSASLVVNSSGTITLAADIATSDGNITFTGPVTLTGDVRVDSDADDDNTDGAIEFTSTIDGGQALTLDADTGAITLDGAVGVRTTEVTSLTVTGGAVSLVAVSATGAVAVTGTGITLAGDVLSNDGNVTFTGPVTLRWDVRVDSDADDDNTDGAIEFTSTIDGGQALELDADTGAITLGGEVGGTTPVASLTVTTSGAVVVLPAVSATGAVAVTARGITLAGAYSSDDGNITFTGPVTLAGEVYVSSDDDGDGTAGDIEFTSTIDGGQALSLDADTGAITLDGAVGDTTPVTSLTVLGGAVSLVAVAATGNIDVRGTGITLAGNVLSNDGNITFTGPVTLAGAVTVNSDQNDSGTAGAIRFTSTIDGGQTLSLDADTGAITLAGAVGGTPVASLTVTGGAVSLAAVTATGDIAVTGTGITLAGAYRSDDGNITFTGPVTLAGAVTVNSDQNDSGADGNIRFTSTINGAYALSLDADTGAITLAGAVGGTPVASLTVTGGAVSLAAVTATGNIAVTGTGITLAGAYRSDDGNITFTGPVTLAGAVTVNSDQNDSGTAGAIRFTSTIDGGQTLSLDADTGAITLAGAVGGTPVASLTVTGGAVSLAAVTATGDIAVTGTGITLAGAYRSDDGNITFTGPVTLAGAVTVNSDQNDSGADGNIRFTSTINGAYALSLDADTGAITLAGAVGGTPVASLTVTGGAVSLAAVTATGNIAVTGTGITLAGAYRSDDGNITFTGPVTLAGAVTVNSDQNDSGTAGAIRFTSTINGAYALSLDADTGAITLAGAVGGTPVASLTVTGGAVSLAAVTATGDIAVTGTGITLAGAYRSDDGNITFTGPVTLAGAVTVNSDQNDSGADGNIRFTSTINGAYALSLDADTGAITLAGAVGGTPVASLTVTTSGAVSLAAVTATGNIAVTGTGITLAGAYRSDDGNITFTGPVTLAGAVTVNSDQNDSGTAGAIRFTSTINGAYALSLDADTGAITLAGAVGGTPVASLTVTGGAVSLAAVTATGDIAVTGTGITLAGAYRSDDGNITFTGPVTLAGAVTVNSDQNDSGADGNIRFTSTINGAYALSLDADTGAITLAGAVGGTPVASLTVTTSGAVSLAAVTATGNIAVTGTGITLAGAYRSDDGNITFTGPVTLAGAVTVNSDQNDSGADGAIRFTSTINGAYALSLDADTGAITLAGAVGGTPVASLTVTTSGAVSLAAVTATGNIAVTGTGITLAGAYRSDDGNITFTGPVTLAGAVTVNSDQNDSGADGAIRFTSTINGAYALSLDADTGAITLAGAVGGTPVASLTVTTSGSAGVVLPEVSATGAVAVTASAGITLAGAYRSDDGNITFTGPVTLAGAVTVNSDQNDSGTAGAIRFTSTINGAYALSLDADTGAITLAGAVGGTPVASLTVTGGAVSLAAVTATGDIAVTGTGITLAGAYRSDDGNITFTGPVTLAGAVTVNSDQNDSGADGNIRFTSTINGAYALSLDADTGAITLAGAVGGTPVASLTVTTSGAVALAAVSATGAVAVTGTGITLAGAYRSDDGNITFTGPVTLAGAVRVDSDADADGTAGDIEFTSTIDGAYALTLDADTGAITLDEVVGSTALVASLTVRGGVVSLVAVRATGNIDVTGTTGITLEGVYRSNDGTITFTGPVTLDWSVWVNSDADNDVTDGNIRFTSTIDGGRDLTLEADDGTITLAGAVGGTTPVTSLTVRGVSVSLAAVTATGGVAVRGVSVSLAAVTATGNIEVKGGTGITLAGNVLSNDGNITFTGPVTLAGAVTVNSDQNNSGADGAIRFTSTIDGGQALTLDADTGAITLDRTVGGTTAVTSLTVTGGAVALSSSVKATGNIDVRGRGITLGRNYRSDDGNVTFTGPVTLDWAVRVDSDADNDGTDGAIEFTSSINGGHALSLDADTGAITLVGAVGGTTPVTSLKVATRGAVSLPAVTVIGNIDVRGGTITLAGAYQSDDGDDITFTGPVTLAGDVRVDSDADDDGTDGDIEFTSTIDGGYALSLDADTGAITLVGAVGGTTPVTSLKVATRGAVSLPAVSATGDIAVTGTGITLAGNVFSNDGNITFTGPVTLANFVWVDSNADNDDTDGDIEFTSTINGGYVLGLDADDGAITLAGTVGGTTPVTSLKVVRGGAVSLAAVRATRNIDVRGMGITLAGDVLSNDGHITFTGPVTLAGAVTVNSDANDDSTDGDIEFTSTIDGGYALTLDADTGAITLARAVGGTTPVTSLTVTGGAVSLAAVAATGDIAVTGTGITLAGNVFSSDGTITFTGPVTLAGAVRVNSDANDDSTDGDIEFTSTIDGGYVLSLDADTGAITLAGAVGSTTPVTSLTLAGGAVSLVAVTATGNIAVTGTGITLAGDVLSNDGNITFTGPVTLAGAVTVNSDANDDSTDGAIEFTSTIDGGYALTLDADTGAITLAGAVGGTTAVASLTVVTRETVALAAVAATGDIDVTGTSIRLAGVYQSDDGNITFTGYFMVTLAGAVRVNSDADADGTDGDIEFTSSINGGHALSLDADTGAITLGGAVGGITAVASLTVTTSGAVVVLPAVTAMGDVAVTATGITLAGVYQSNDGNITFTGPVTLAGDVTVNSDANDDSTAGVIRFTSTIDGGYALGLDSDTGAIRLAGAVGGTTPVTSLTVAGGAVSLAAVTATGDIDVTGTGIRLAGAYRSDDGNVTFTGPVTLAGDVTVNSDDDGDGTAGDIEFTSTIDGGYALTLDADTGAITLGGAVGGTTPVVSLTVTGGAVSLAAVTATGDMAVTGTGLTLAGAYRSDDGNITFTGPVTLAGAVTVNSDAAAPDSTDGVRFTSTIDGGYALTLDADTGEIALAGAVGGITAVASLTVTGRAVSLAAVTATGAVDVRGIAGIRLAGDVLSNDGNITFDGPVTLAGAVTVNSDQNNSGADGAIRFTSTIEGGQALTLDADTGAITLAGAVGGATPVTSLTVRGGAVSLARVRATGAVAVTGSTIRLAGQYNSDDGNITFTGPVTLAGAVQVDSDADDDGTDGDIEFTSSINGGQALTLDADTGEITLAGAVGGTIPVVSLTVTGGAVSLAAVTATGSIDVTGTGITLEGAYRSDDGNITFTGPVTLAGAVTVNSDANDDGTDGDIEFTSSINGGQALTLDADTGTIRLAGAVGDTTPVTSLTVAGGAVSLAAVTATGDMEVTGTGITLAGAVEVTSLTVTGGAVSLAAVTATGDIAVTGTTGITLAGMYRSDDGTITFTGPVTLAGAVTVNSDANDDGTDGDIEFTSTIDGGYALSLDADTGAITLAGAVGGTTPVTSLTVAGGAVSLAAVTATGDVEVTGTGITLAGAVEVTSLTVAGGAVSLAEVTATGNIDVTGTTGITLAGAYRSDDGNITFTGPVTLAGAVTVNSDADDDSTDGDIEFTSTIDGGYALRLDADTGAITLAGAVGGTTPVASLTVTGGAVSLAAVTATGAVAVTGTGITLAGVYRSDEGNVIFTGPVTLAGAVTVNSDANGDGTDGDIRFASTIDGGQALTLDADTGAVTLAGAAGGTTPVASLTVAGGAVSLAAVTATGNIDVTGTTGITLAGAYRSDDGNVIFTGPVTLAGAVTVNSDANADGTDGDIRFTSTIDGGYALSLDADTGAITLAGVVGGTTAVASLTVTTSGAVALAAVTATGAVAVTGTGITLAGNVLSNDGNVTFTGPVTLAGAVTVNSDANYDGTDGDIRFTSTIDGGYALSLDADTGAITLAGAVGGTTQVASLTVTTSGAVALAAVTATGDIAVTGTGITLAGNVLSSDGNVTFTGPVTLAGAVTVNSDANADGTDGDIRFTSTIDGGYALVLDADTGAITLAGAVGGTTAVASLTVRGGAVELAAVTATGAVDVRGIAGITLAGAYRSDDGNITFTGPVTLAYFVWVNSDANADGTDGDIRFTSTIDGGQVLVLDADTGTITLAGAVGGTTAVASLTVTGGAVSLAAVTATGNIDVTGTGLTLAGAYRSNDGNVTFTGPVTLAGAVTVNSDANADGTDGAIEFTSTIDGGYALSLDADTGAITLAGAVGGTTPVASLTVTTSGAVVALPEVTATGNIDVTGTTGITLAGAYRSDDGNVTFTGPVTLANFVWVNSDANADGTAGDIEFTSTIDGGYALGLDADTGAITLAGAVGGTTPVVSLTVKGGAVELAAVTATGAVAVTGTGITLAGNVLSNDGNVTFTGPVTLAGAVTVNSDANGDGTDGAIEFTSTIDGGYALSLDADTGAITLAGAVGGTTPVTSLTVTGGAVSLAAVTATGDVEVTGTGLTLAGAYRSDDGNVTFTGPVTLAGAVTVNSDANGDGTDGDIRFTSTIDGGYALSLNADTGNIHFEGDVGSTAKLGAMTITKAHDVTVGTSMRVTSFQQLAGTGTSDFGFSTLYSDTFVNVSTKDIKGRIIAKDVTLKSSNHIGVTVEVDSLTIEAKSADIKGTVGGETGTGNMVVTTTTGITLAGVYRSDDGNITFTGPVTLAGDVTVNSDADGDGTAGDIRFTSTIDGGYALSLDANTGAITLAGAVGGTTAVTSLTVTGGAVALAAVTATGDIDVRGTGLTLEGAYRSDDGNVTFTGPVTLAGAVTVNSDADGDGMDGAIEFTSTIDGGYALGLDANTGAITLAGAVGGTTPVTSLTVAGGAVSLVAVTATGDIDVTGTGLTLEGAYRSDDGNVTFTGPVTLAGAVTVNSDADGDGMDGAIEFTSTIDGGYALGLDADTGAITLAGAVGSTALVASLTVAGGAVSLVAVTATGDIDVTGTGLTLEGAYRSDDGNVTFTGPVTLAGAVTVNSDADGDGMDGAIEFTSTIDGGYALGLDADTGAITLAGAVGSTALVASLTVAGGAVSLVAVTATGNIDVTGTGLTLAGAYRSDDGNVTFTGPVTLAGAVTVNSDADGDGTAGDIRFTSTIDGGYALSLDANTGAITLAGAVGGTTAVTSLTVTGGAVALAAVTATGDIDVRGTGLTLEGAYRSDDGNVTFTGPVTLAGAVTVNSDADGDGMDGAIEFTSTIDGGYALGLDANTGAITLAGAVGGTTPVTSLTVAGGAVSLVAVTATGDIDVTGTGLTLEGAYRSDDGNVTFTGPVTLAGAVTVNSDADGDGMDGAIEFTSTIDGGYALGLDADTGAITLAGAVGSTALVASLTVAGGAVSLVAVTATGNIDVTGTGLTLAGAYRSDDGNVTFTGPVTLAGAVTVNSDADGDGMDGAIEFTSTIDGGYALGLDANTGAITLAGAVGGGTPVASLTVAGGAVSLAAVTATGDVEVTGTGLTLAGAYRSDDGNVTFTGPVTLAGAVTVNSDADADGTDGDIRFTSTIDGGYALGLNADTGNIHFEGDVGSTAKLGAMTITKAHDVTVGTSMRVTSFQQLAGTGTSDFGFSTLYSDTFVNVSTKDIKGRIIAKDVTLKSSNHIGVTVEVDSLTIEAKSADIKGTVGGETGQGAASKTIIRNKVPGMYKLNDFTSLGIGPEMRQYAELAALPLPNTTWRWGGAPGDVVFLPFSTILRASVMGAMDRSYPVNVFEMPFALLKPQTGMESIYDTLPGGIRDVWWRLGTDAMMNTHDGNDEDHYKR